MVRIEVNISERGKSGIVRNSLIAVNPVSKCAQIKHGGD